MTRGWSAITLAFAASALFAQPTPSDVPGWAKTRWGMTEAQVRLALPSVRPSTAEDKVSDDALYCPFALPSLTIDDYTFRVAFVFDKSAKTLQMVSLSLAESENKSASSAFRSLAELLTAKYGAAAATTDGMASVQVLKWSFPKTTIRLMFISSLPSSSRPLYVFYGSTKSRGIDSL